MFGRGDVPVGEFRCLSVMGFTTTLMPEIMGRKYVDMIPSLSCLLISLSPLPPSLPLPPSPSLPPSPPPFSHS